MSRFSGFVRRCTGGVGIDWIVLGAGLTLLAVTVVYELYRGATLINAPEQNHTAVTMDTRGTQPRGEG